MSSAAPGLKMQFEDCFYLIVEIRRTSKREAKECRMGVDACAPCRTSLVTHSRAFSCLCLLQSHCFSTKNRRKMLGGDWSWVYSTPPSRHLIFCTQHANHTQPGPVISGRSGLCLSSCHECLQSAAFKISRGVFVIFGP